MDKCREEFEVVARKNGWNLTTYPEITGRIDYVNVLTEQAWQMFQHQQAKVEELQKQLSEYIFVAETIDEMYVKEVQKSDELQKRVDAAKYYMKNIFSGVAEVDRCHLGDLLDILDGEIVDELEQALKGEG
ncbi:hypothetical protein LJI64_001801 [Acinetobacter baumannii]